MCLLIGADNICRNRVRSVQGCQNQVQHGSRASTSAFFARYFYEVAPSACPSTRYARLLQTLLYLYLSISRSRWSRTGSVNCQESEIVVHANVVRNLQENMRHLRTFSTLLSALIPSSNWGRRYLTGS